MMRFFAVLCLLLAAVWATAAESFKWSVRPGETGNVITLQIAPGCYINAEQLNFELTSNGKKISPAQSPEAQTTIIDGEKSLIYPAGVWQWHFAARQLDGGITWQGCLSDGTCLLPETWYPGTPETVPAASVQTAALPDFTVVRMAEGYMDKEAFSGFLQGSSVLQANLFANAAWYWLLLLVLAGGVALNFTPCVLPMVPINLAIIGAAEGGRTGFRRGFCYGSGMAIAYGILGILTVLAGSTFGELNSFPSFNFAIAGVFLLLSLVMAGVINFNFAANFRVDPGKLNFGRSLAAFCMGALSALLAGACVAPVVTSVLIFTASEYHKGNTVALALPFLLGIGMALPWPFAGLGLAVLPRPGKFMVTIKYVLAVVIAAMGIYYLILGINLLPDSDKSDAASSVTAAVEQALLEAERQNRPLLLFFSASWCKNCHAMEKNVLPEVRSKIDRDFVFLKINAENPAAPDVAPLLKKLDIHGFPAFAILSSK